MSQRPPQVSVVTLVRDRQSHLDAVIEGLGRQRYDDFELVIASMQPEPPVVAPGTPFEVTIVPVSGQRLPLAAARNTAARSARGDRLVFLDVDCIPSPSLVATYADHLAEFDHCAMGEVRYLPAVDPGHNDSFETLAAIAHDHPGRPSVPERGWCFEPQPRALWGLSFALRKSRYFHAGPMDESFDGYGAEETDFAEALHRANTRFVWCAGALALHQHHAVYSPPLHRFDDIVRNATRFRAKWGSWCMEYWLEQFARAGYVRWDRHGSELRILRRPDASEVRNALAPGDVAFA